MSSFFNNFFSYRKSMAGLRNKASSPAENILMYSITCKKQTGAIIVQLVR